MYPTVLVISFLSHLINRFSDMDGSDNPFGADNQQERLSSSDWLEAIPLDLGHYIAGFVEGEGSFNVPIRRERDERSERSSGQAAIAPPKVSSVSSS